MGWGTLTKPLMGATVGGRRYCCLLVVIPEEGRLVPSVNRGQRCCSTSPVHRQPAHPAPPRTAHPKPSVSWRSGLPGLEEGRPFSLQDTRGPLTCQSAVPEGDARKDPQLVTVHTHLLVEAPATFYSNARSWQRQPSLGPAFAHRRARVQILRAGHIGAPGQRSRGVRALVTVPACGFAPGLLHPARFPSAAL